MDRCKYPAPGRSASRFATTSIALMFTVAGLAPGSAAASDETTPTVPSHKARKKPKHETPALDPVDPKPDSAASDPATNPAAPEWDADAPAKAAPRKPALPDWDAPDPGQHAKPEPVDGDATADESSKEPAPAAEAQTPKHSKAARAKDEGDRSSERSKRFVRGSSAEGDASKAEKASGAKSDDLELESSAASEQAAASAKDVAKPSRQYTFGGARAISILSASATPSLSFGVAVGPGVVIALGGQFSYAPSTDSSGATYSRFASSVLFEFEYLPLNTTYLALGPSVQAGTPVAPGTPFTDFFVAPGVTFWVTPVLGAPVAIGSGIDARLEFPASGPMTIAVSWPGIRFAFFFN